MLKFNDDGGCKLQKNIDMGVSSDTMLVWKVAAMVCKIVSWVILPNIVVR